MPGPHCVANPPKLSSTYGDGHVQELGGLNCYVSGPSHSKFAVLLVSDIFGYEAMNLRKVADKVAGAGFYVVVPDFFHGDPYVEDGVRPVGVWLKDHTVDNVTEDAKLVIEALKAGCVTKVGVGGICSGGYYRSEAIIGVSLPSAYPRIYSGYSQYIYSSGKSAVDLAKIPCVEAAVLLHPAFVTLDDIQGVKAPISVLGAENDETTPPKLVKEFHIALQAKAEVDSFVKIYPNVTHGWTVRYDEDDKVAVKAAEEAHQDLLKWLVKHLH